MIWSRSGFASKHKLMVILLSSVPIAPLYKWTQLYLTWMACVQFRVMVFHIQRIWDQPLKSLKEFFFHERCLLSNSASSPIQKPWRCTNVCQGICARGKANFGWCQRVSTLVAGRWDWSLAIGTKLWKHAEDTSPVIHELFARMQPAQVGTPHGVVR